MSYISYQYEARWIGTYPKKRKNEKKKKGWLDWLVPCVDDV